MTIMSKKKTIEFRKFTNEMITKLFVQMLRLPAVLLPLPTLRAPSDVCCLGAGP